MLPSGQVAVRAEEGEFLCYNSNAVVGYDDDATQPQDLPVGERQQDEANRNDEMLMRGPDVTNQVSMFVLAVSPERCR